MHAAGDVSLVVQLQARAIIYGIIVGMSAYAAAADRREQRAAFRRRYQEVRRGRDVPLT